MPGCHPSGHSYAFMKLSGKSTPSWYISLIPFIVLIVTMTGVISVFGADALDGGSQVALIISSGVAIAIAMFVYGCPWKKLEEAVEDNIKCISSGILILILIGAISGSWMISGIVPTLICYGLKIISPKIFLFAVCIICALVSVMTGSSWTTVATIGVAMLGIGSALGFSPLWTAGAIISGAYFGDKISPLSDTTVLASSVSGVPLMSHIRYMMVTTVPSFVISLIVFLIVSLSHGAVPSDRISSTSEVLHGTFTISPWLLIVPVLTGILIAKRVPAFLTLLCSAAMAGIAAAIAQPQILQQIAGDGVTAAGFKGIMISYFGDTAIDTGDELFNSLVATGGMNGMMPTIFLIICAATFGGILTGSGMIRSLTEVLTKRISSRTGMVSATVASGIVANGATGDQYLSIILTCSLFKKFYQDNGYEERLLSRAVEDSATVTSVLIPWTSCGMTQSTILHIPTIEYIPYCLFNLISPLMSITVAAIGYKVFRHGEPIRSKQ